jgi:hypothetical protein
MLREVPGVPAGRRIDALADREIGAKIPVQPGAVERHMEPGKGVQADINILVQRAGRERARSEAGESESAKDVQFKRARGPAAETVQRGSLAGKIIESDRGRPLTKTQQTLMEAYFGRDMGGVRVHEGSLARRVTGAFGAEAFAAGRDIFVPGKKAETAPGSLGLLAHEITHIIQQTQPRPIDVRPESKASPRPVARAESDARREEQSMVSVLMSERDRRQREMKTPVLPMEHTKIYKAMPARDDLLQHFGDILPDIIDSAPSVGHALAGEMYNQLVYQLFNRIKQEIELERERMGGFC